VVRWRQLSEREYLRYYLLTKLFGTRLEKPLFRDHFGQNIHDRLRWETLLLKLAGTIDEDPEQILVNRQGMYTVSVMMREFFAALNTLREHAIENQI
jgi:menaquinone C8-methyltransferase